MKKDACKKEERARFTFRLAKRDLDTLKKIAKEQGISTNTLMIRIIKEVV